VFSRETTFRYRVNKAHRIRLCSYIAVQHGVVADVRSILRACVFSILRKHRAVQIDTGKQPLAARVCQKLRTQRSIRRGLCVAAYRAGCCCRITAQLELAAQHMLQAVFIHRYQDQVG